MELINRPTNITTLKTFTDSKGTQYELRGQKDMYSNTRCHKTNYYELHKKGKKDYDFNKVGAKEELYVDFFNGYEPVTIKRERFDGKLIETSKVAKTLNGYDIACIGESLTTKGQVNVLHLKEDGVAKTKVKLADSITVNGYKKLSNMAKHILKLISHA